MGVREEAGSEPGAGRRGQQAERVCTEQSLRRTDASPSQIEKFTKERDWNRKVRGNPCREAPSREGIENKVGNGCGWGKEVNDLLGWGGGAEAAGEGAGEHGQCHCRHRRWL